MKKNLVCLIEIRSVKDSIRKDLIPNTGSIFVQERRPNPHEMDMAQWILKKFGDDITFLRENRDKALETPDATWSGVELEIKMARGKSSIDTQIRKGIQQINNNRVILLDITENKKDFIKIKEEAIHRISRSILITTKQRVNIVIIFLKRRKIMDIIEIYKRKNKSRH